MKTILTRGVHTFSTPDRDETVTLRRLDEWEAYATDRRGKVLWGFSGSAREVGGALSKRYRRPVVVSEVDWRHTHDEEQATDEYVAAFERRLESLLLEARGKSAELGGDFRGPAVRARLLGIAESLVGRLR